MEIRQVNALVGCSIEATQTTCLFCLEPVETKKPALLKCSCKFHCHQECWNEYTAKTVGQRCPICRTATINPMLPPVPLEAVEVVIWRMDENINIMERIWARTVLLFKIILFLGVSIPTIVVIVLLLEK